MDPMLKQRLVGAAVLVALAVIFVPMLFDSRALDDVTPREPLAEELDEQEFNSRVIPLDDSFVSSAREAASKDLTAGEPAPAKEREPPADADATNGQVPSSESEPSDTPIAEPASAPEVKRAVPETVREEERIGVDAWVVQLGVFTNRENADALESRARAAGHSAYVEPVTTADGTAAWRVRVGPELLRSNAEKTRDELKQAIGIEGIVRQHR
jgi:DedD protein